MLMIASTLMSDFFTIHYEQRGDRQSETQRKEERKRNYTVSSSTVYRKMSRLIVIVMQTIKSTEKTFFSLGVPHKRLP